MQKDRCFKEQKICSNSSTLPAGNDVRWAQGVSARSVLHLQKDRCLEGAGKAALELDAAYPSLTGFPVSRIFQCELRQSVPISRRFFGPYKKQRGLRNSRSTPAGTASRPFNQNLPSETPSRPLNPESPSETPLHPFNQNLPSETPSRPSPRIPHPKPPHTTQSRISNLPSKSSLFY